METEKTTAPRPRNEDDNINKIVHSLFFEDCGRRETFEISCGEVINRIAGNEYCSFFNLLNHNFCDHLKQMEKQVEKPIQKCLIKIFIAYKEDICDRVSKFEAIFNEYSTHLQEHPNILICVLGVLCQDYLIFANFTKYKEYLNQFNTFLNLYSSHKFLNLILAFHTYICQVLKTNPISDTSCLDYHLQEALSLSQYCTAEKELFEIAIWWYCKDKNIEQIEYCVKLLLLHYSDYLNEIKSQLQLLSIQYVVDVTHLAHYFEKREADFYFDQLWQSRELDCRFLFQLLSHCSNDLHQGKVIVTIFNEIKNYQIKVNDLHRQNLTLLLGRLYRTLSYFYLRKMEKICFGCEDFFDVLNYIQFMDMIFENFTSKESTLLRMLILHAVDVIEKLTSKKQFNNLNLLFIQSFCCRCYANVLLISEAHHMFAQWKDKLNQLNEKSRTLLYK